MKASKWIGFDVPIRGIHVRIAVSSVTMAFEWRIEPDSANMQVAREKAIRLAEVAIVGARAQPGERWEVFIEGEDATARRRR